METAHAIIIGLDAAGNVVSFNKYAEDMTGYPPDGIMGRNILEISALKDRYPYVLGKFQEWQSGRLSTPLTVENVLYRTDEEERFISWHISEMRNGKDISGIICCGIDVTGLKKYESDISVRNLELLTLQKISEIVLKEESIDDAFQHIVDEMVTATGFPIAAIELIDETKEKMVFKGVSGIPGIEKDFEIPVEETPSGIVIRTGRPIVEEDGWNREEYRNYLLHELGVKTFLCIPMTTNSRVVGAVSLAHMEQVKVEPHLVQLLSAAANHIASVFERKRAMDELEKNRKLESIGLLAGGIAHDFNNLLTVILGNISFAKMRGELPGDVLKLLSGAETASIKATALTDQLLTFSKGGSPIKKAILVKTLIEDVVRDALTGHLIEYKYVFEESCPMAYVDEHQMRQALRNIFVNAKEAMPGGGTISIGTKTVSAGQDGDIALSEGDYTVIAIEDTGRGIKEEDLSKIFDPYFTTKPMGAKKGMGLGLAVAHSVVKRHGGCIKVDSRVGSGSTFHLYLPALPRRAASSPRQKIGMDYPAASQGESMMKQNNGVGSRQTFGSKPAEQSKMTNIGEGGRILLVDDNESVRNVAAILLARLGYKTDVAKDGIEAIELYRKAQASDRPLDAVILDLIIPEGMGGKEILSKLYEIDPAVKAVVTSGYSGDSIIREYRKHGFKGAIVKPYNGSQLAKVLKEVLE
jgi:PAS domain S-box-containing protein